VNKKHTYKTSLVWDGANGVGTTNYRAYSRNHIISVAGKPPLLCSSDPVFRGDGAKYSPEDLLVASLSGCHMLWYLHLCADAGVVVTAYTDSAEGIMMEDENGDARFTEVTLNPLVIIKEVSMEKMALELHHAANQKCFIANSCNFPVKHNPIIKVEGK
jgi:organic hydroperoxide reductase OsmC/OhrA